MRAHPLASSSFVVLAVLATIAVACDSGPDSNSEPPSGAGGKASGGAGVSGNGQAGSLTAKGGGGPGPSAGASQAGGSGPATGGGPGAAGTGTAGTLSSGGSPGVAGTSSTGGTTAAGGSVGTAGTGQGGTGSSGTFCGGIAGIPCAKGQFCNLEGNQCGTADAGGVCTDLPQACTFECQQPGVCGCDGKRHCSACQANAQGISVAPESFCNPGPTPRACGTKGVPPCFDGEFCDRSQAKTCGEADEPGVCKAQPTACTKECQSPGVCGCDGQRRCSACTTEALGVSVAPNESYCKPLPNPDRACGSKGLPPCLKGELCDHSQSKTCGEADEPGLCKSLPVDPCPLCKVSTLCGCDGNLYCTSCDAELAGTSAAPSNSYCGTVGKTCGGKIGIQCAAGEYCSFTKQALCGFADATGVCEKKQVKCDTSCDLIAHCGCDGQNYCNTCALSANGVSEAPDQSYCKGLPNQ